MQYIRYSLITALLLVSIATLSVGQTPPLDPAGKLLPERLGDYKALGAVEPLKAEIISTSVTSSASRIYVSKDGQKHGVWILTSPSNSSAYAKLTQMRLALGRGAPVEPINVGTQAFQTGSQLVFVKGLAMVVAKSEQAGKDVPPPPVDLAKAIADTIDKGDGDIPVLIKHLPDWENVYQGVFYAVDKNSLTQAFAAQPILEALSFEGGAEAAVADYSGAKMVLIEFNTPQIAADNDQRIAARLNELRSQGQPVPAAYRRVGNYAVFVFDTPSEQAATQLIDHVKYQQMVQWLGENPYRYDQAVREFSETTLGVFVSVVKASGLVLLGSMAVGGLFGAFLFTRRRKQRTAMEAYSDAGGMLRLNLDDLTATKDPARLLGPGN